MNDEQHDGNSAKIVKEHSLHKQQSTGGAIGVTDVQTKHRRTTQAYSNRPCKDNHSNVAGTGNEQSLHELCETGNAVVAQGDAGLRDKQEPKAGSLR